MTVIARYQGPATVVIPGERWAADVDLVVEREGQGLKHWHGQIKLTPDAGWAAFQAGSAQLELPNGRTGNFILNALGDGGGEVSGSGPAPFGDL